MWRAFIATAVLVSASACLVEIADVVPSGGGMGGAGATAGVGGAGATGAGGVMTGGGGTGSDRCPPEMVLAENANVQGVAFCIDRTEVTRTDYLTFTIQVGDDVANTEQPSECMFNDDLTESGHSSCPDFSTMSDLPANCVDWCDAYAYCAWAGKRLCGGLMDGGPLANDDPPTDEWHFACTGGLETTYPYGDQAELCACFNAEEHINKMVCDYANISNPTIKVAVGSYGDCEGGFPGLFDMQANVAEWTARCAPGTGAGDEECVTRGGHTYSDNGSSYWQCDNLALRFPRSDASFNVGFRCCADAAP